MTRIKVINQYRNGSQELHSLFTEPANYWSPVRAMHGLQSVFRDRDSHLTMQFIVLPSECLHSG